jgi:hypothetical protein
LLLEAGQPGALTLFNHPIDDGRVQRNFHAGFARHILAEVWEPRLVAGFKHPETKWWHSGRPNHWFDATYAAIVARSVKGINPVRVAARPPQPTTKATHPATQPAASNKQAATPQPTKNAPDTTPQQRRPEVSTRRRISFRR